jgi:hypothetical protein
VRNQSTLWMDMGEPVAALEVIDECMKYVISPYAPFGPATILIPRRQEYEVD